MSPAGFEPTTYRLLTKPISTHGYMFLMMRHLSLHFGQHFFDDDCGVVAEVWSTRFVILVK